MSVHLIPLQPSQPDVQFGVTLESTHYTMHVYWNDRDVAWYFDIFDPGGAAIAYGIKIVLGAQLGKNCNAAPFTTGVFMAFDTSGQELDAGIDDLGTRVQLYYMPVEDYLQTLQAVLPS
jgi:hypothetical protein